MCMCLKDHLDAKERKQDKCPLEIPLDFEEDVFDDEVKQNESIPLSDEEIALDASSEGTLSPRGPRYDYMMSIMGNHDFLCLPEWTGAEVQEEPYFDASISGATLRHVAKRTRSALAQSFGSTTPPILFVGDSDDESDGDDDACVEIPLVTPLRSASMIPSSGNQGRRFTAPTAKGSNTRGSISLSSVLYVLISGFFLIDRRAIPYSMVWRHTDAAIDDPRPAAGSFSIADAVPIEMGADGNVMGNHDFLCLPEWTGAEVQEEPYFDVRSKKASISGATLSHVAKRTRSALAQSFGSTTPPILFVGDSDDESDGDDDACVEIPLVTPFRSASMIPSSGNQGRSFTAPTAKGSNTRDSQGKDIMADDATALFVGASRLRTSSGPAPLFRMFLDDSYWPTFRVLTNEVFKDPAICKTMVDQFSTPSEMVRVEALFEDQLTANMSVIHLDSRMKGYEERVAGVARLELQVSTLKKQVSRLNDKLVSFDASFAKSKCRLS
nr:hypothetical protein [Tanacetum cinerariifolium]